SRNVLARLLDEPQLVSAIRSLDTSTFHALVEHVGIADAGELVAMATDEQLLHVLDETLWSQRPGVTETFSHHAFVTWLEVPIGVAMSSRVSSTSRSWCPRSARSTPPRSTPSSSTWGSPTPASSSRWPPTSNCCTCSTRRSGRSVPA